MGYTQINKNKTKQKLRIIFSLKWVEIILDYMMQLMLNKISKNLMNKIYKFLFTEKNGLNRAIMWIKMKVNSIYKIDTFSF